jgi:hypothetical protein
VKPKLNNEEFKKRRCKMGRLLLIAVIFMGGLFSNLILSMNKSALKLPQVLVNDISSKETQNLSNYAMRYALQFAETQHFPTTVGFTKKQAFTNFFYRYGYIDSIRYSYSASAANFKIKAYTRTTVAGKSVTHCSVAAIKGINMIGGKGNLAHWSFDNNFNDSSPNHNDGTGYNGIRFQNNGLSNAAVFIDGRDDYITVNDSPTLDMPVNFSWAVWGNWNSDPSGWIPFMWKPSMPTDLAYRNKPSYGLWIYCDYIHAGILTQNLEWIEAVSTTMVKPQGTWHLMCITYNGLTLKIYYDGVVIASATGTVGGPIYNSNQQLTQARIQYNGSYIYFKGRMDEIGFYDFTFTPAQVLSIWNSANGILPSITGTPIVDYVKE